MNIQFFAAILYLAFSSVMLNAENLVPQLNFQNTSQWTLPNGCSILPVGGKFGDQVLQIIRTDKNVYNLAGYGLNLKKLQKGKSYRFCGWIKSDGNASGQIAVEFSRGGKYLTGSYSKCSTNTEWTMLDGHFDVPDGADHAVLTVYMSRGKAGKITFCGLTVEKSVLPSKIISFIKSPCNHPLVRNGTIEVILGLKCLNLPETSLRWQVLNTNAKLVNSGILSPNCNEIKVLFPLELGTNRLIFRVIDKRGKIVAEDTQQLVTTSQANLPAHACIIDDCGRAIVNGKKFMPIGLYCYWNEPRVKKIPKIAEDIETIRKSSFNCIMDYNSSRWPGERAKYQHLKSTLDMYAAAGIKVIFPTTLIKDADLPGCVSAIRNHPALLAWYLADEAPPKAVPYVKARYEKMNLLDPWHPTWAVYNRSDVIPNYASTCNVFGIDPYPIVKGGESLDLVVNFMEQLNQTLGEKKPKWIVPQFFNIGNYTAEKDLKNYKANFKAPTENEMLTICFIEAIMGAKGFVGYSFFDLRTGPADTTVQFAERWPILCRIADSLKKAEPFIMGDGPSSSVKYQTSSGQIIAKTFTADDGRRAVMIATPTATGANAVFKIKNSATFKSLRGVCARQANGQWQFSSSGVECELLYEPDTE